ncbi:MAG: hypothetical protein M3394_03790 [Actinomycetota bacterium]|nr:hypothetical protein [Actinomycetota bacterium]
MPAETEGPDAAGPDDAGTVAKLLTVTTATVAGVLTTFGLNTDRVWVALDQRGTKPWLVIIGIAAVLAIALSVVALLFFREQPVRRTIVLVFGALFYVGALVGALLVAGDAGNLPGRPSISTLELTPAEGGAQLKLAVSADRVDNDQTVSVAVLVDGREAYRARVPSDGEGTANTAVSLFLPQADADKDITVKAWVTEKVGDDCQRVRLWGPFCTTITRSAS